MGGHATTAGTLSTPVTPIALTAISSGSRRSDAKTPISVAGAMMKFRRPHIDARGPESATNDGATHRPEIIVNWTPRRGRQRRNRRRAGAQPGKRGDHRAFRIVSREAVLEALVVGQSSLRRKWTCRAIGRAARASRRVAICVWISSVDQLSDPPKTLTCRDLATRSTASDSRSPPRVERAKAILHAADLPVELRNEVVEPTLRRASAASRRRSRVRVEPRDPRRSRPPDAERADPTSASA